MIWLLLPLTPMVSGVFAAQAADSAGARPENEAVPLADRDREFMLQAAEHSQYDADTARLGAERAQDPEVRALAASLVRECGTTQDELRAIAGRHGLDLLGKSNESASPGSAITGAGSTDNTYVPRPAATSDSLAERSESAGARPDEPSNRETSPAPENPPRVAKHALDPAVGGVPAAERSDAAARERADAKDRDLRAERHARTLRELSEQGGPEFDRTYLDLTKDAHQDAIARYANESEKSVDPTLKEFAATHLTALKAALQKIEYLQKRGRSAE